jgi:hypothetical protein
MQGYATGMEELENAVPKGTYLGIPRGPEPGLPPMSEMAYKLLIHARYIAVKGWWQYRAARP